MERMHPYKSKIVVCANYTTICARKHRNERFDFVYVDARHDYKGVLLDLEDWWPLVNEGGIMAGHDYVYQNEG
jgi:predicted O-methyltransferase YrrM